MDLHSNRFKEWTAKSLYDQMHPLHQRNPSRQQSKARDGISFLLSPVILMTLFADRITMEEKVIALESDMANLKERARGLGCVLTKMRERYPLLNEMVSQLIERDARITLRDVCIAMEWLICVQAAGSKARAKNGLFNFEKIQESADDACPVPRPRAP
jgi:hypothetical protein